MKIVCPICSSRQFEIDVEHVEKNKKKVTIICSCGFTQPYGIISGEKIAIKRRKFIERKIRKDYDN